MVAGAAKNQRHTAPTHGEQALQVHDQLDRLKTFSGNYAMTCDVFSCASQGNSFVAHGCYRGGAVIEWPHYRSADAVAHGSSLC